MNAIEIEVKAHHHFITKAYLFQIKKKSSKSWSTTILKSYIRPMMMEIYQFSLQLNTVRVIEFVLFFFYGKVAKFCVKMNFDFFLVCRQRKNGENYYWEKTRYDWHKNSLWRTNTVVAFLWPLTMVNIYLKTLNIEA